MATSIEWTDATVNPIRARNRETGAVGHYCEKVSPGCSHCYASRWNERVRPIKSATGQKLIGTGLSFDVRNREKVDPFLDVTKLLEVVRRRQPTKWFWCDMTDMFGEWVPDEWIDSCFAVMAATPQHTHQVLTKRAGRMRTYSDFRSRPPASKTTQQVLVDHALEIGIDHAPAVKVIGLSKWPLPNVWLGVSAEDQPRADERIGHLLQTPAAVRFISAEPLLGPIELEFIGEIGATFSALGCRPCAWKQDCATTQSGPHTCGVPSPHLDWVIVGGESGPSSRSTRVQWIRDVVAECRAASVPVFVKQLGANPEGDTRPAARIDPVTGARTLTVMQHIEIHDRKGGDPSEWPEDLRVREFPQ